MPEIAFVFPNLSDSEQRGSPSTRDPSARNLGCSFIEIPADLIKNRTEAKATGLSVGSFLTGKEIEKLYRIESVHSPLPYILHTEPSIPRTDAYGMRTQAPICWHDPAWTARMAEMVVAIAERFGPPPAAVEIHPGDRRNGYADVVGGMIALREAFEDGFGAAPAVFLENRTDGQFIGDGGSIAGFWRHLLSAAPELAGGCGIVLDVQQLYTVTKEDFLKSLARIPLDSLRALHVHARHRAPGLDDPVPWRDVFAWIGGIDRRLLINPEVHHLNQVGATIEFCRAMFAPGDTG